MKKLFFIVLLLIIYGIGDSQNFQKQIDSLQNVLQELKNKEDSVYYQLQVVKLDKLHDDLRKLGLPKLEKGEEIVWHHAMCLVYNEKYEQAKWVAHIISTDIANGGYGRTNDFRPDPLVKTGSAEEADYFLKYLQPDSTYKYDGFGFDRGHLAPSADFRWSKIALSESYYYSNMSPQRPEFNRGGWADLEDLMRAYVIEKNTALFIVTGPIFGDTVKYVLRSKNHVAIPDYFFKVAYDSLNHKGIAFIMPNADIIYPTEYYAVTIDSVEKRTGIDFFPALPDSIENKMEAQLDISWWLPKQQKGDVPPMKPSELPMNYFNTIQAQHFIDDGKKVKICGTVVSTYKSRKGNVFLNLDKKYPKQIFTITIFKNNLVNFSYSPDVYLKGKKICVYGKVGEFRGVPSMVIENEKQILFYDDVMKKVGKKKK